MSTVRAENDAEPVPDVSVVVLTRGDRPAELSAAVDSIRDQAGVAVEVVVLANGVPATDVGVERAADVVVRATGENLGIPGGRNAGATHATAPLVAFLDDDARLIDVDVLRRAVDSFAADPALGVLALHIVDEHGATSRRHVPRVGAGDPERSGPVTAFLGGAVVMRASALAGVGGYADEFFYAMEETDLALRLVDEGWTIHYDGTPSVFHPATQPARHDGAAQRTMRNRVWLAHRNLPAPIAVLYIANWLAISAIRQPRAIGVTARAIVDAWRSRPGPRRPIRWATVATLTRLGRPPIV